jgi:hypothetical protein
MRTLLRACLNIAAILALCAVVAHTEDHTAKSLPAKTNSAPASSDCGMGSIAVQATPDHADILVDGSFAGNAPAALKLSPGKHSIRLTAPGYGEWQRELTVFGGSQARLAVTLLKTTDATSASAPASPVATAAPTQVAPATAAVALATQSSAAECAALGAFSDEHPKNRSDGIKVTGFAPHSPAAKAGLQIGDYIVAVAGTYVFSIDDLSTELCKHQPGAQVALRYRRNAALDETTVVLGRP